jgi:alkylation response protein AidB-like acyl-CoA dehydrogenase
MALDQSARQEIVDTFARVVEAHCPRGTSYETIGVEDGALWEALASGGWLSVGADEASGGSALDLFDLALLGVEWGRRAPPLPFSTTVLAHRWGVDSDPGQRLSFALPAADGVVIPFAEEARVDSDYAAADADPFAPSLPVTRTEGESRLTPEQVTEVQVMFAAEAVGAAQEIFDRAIAYSQERVAYGAPISGFQAMRHFMADMLADLELAKTALFWAISTEGAERRRALGVCVARSQKVAADAIQVYGGIGYTWDLGAHRYLRHAMAAREIAGLGRSN